MRRGRPIPRHESLPQVSTPNSPSRGTTLKVQSSSPLRTSYPRRFSGAFPFQRIPESPAPSSTPATTMTSFTTMGPELQLNRSAEAGTRSTLPPSPKSGRAWPVAGSRA